MKRWKKVLLGVVGSGLLSWNVAEAVTIRNGPSGNSRQENVAIALLDVLNTDGSMNHTGVNSHTGAETHTGLETFTQMAFGTETLTTDAQDPGTGTASLSAIISVVTSDATGTAQDVVTLPDGTVAGQVHIFILEVDGETAGTAIAPTSVVMTGGAGTSTLLETIGDTVEFTWGGGDWYLTGNVGGTVQ